MGRVGRREKWFCATAISMARRRRAAHSQAELFLSSVPPRLANGILRLSIPFEVNRMVCFPTVLYCLIERAISSAPLTTAASMVSARFISWRPRQQTNGGKECSTASQREEMVRSEEHTSELQSRFD